MVTGPVRQQLRDQGSDARRLRWLLLGLLLALLIPTSILASRAYQQLGYESLYRYRLTAENVAQTIDAQLAQLLATEADRGIEQFDYFVHQRRTLRSPLSEPDGRSALAGALGYFKIDAAGHLSTPLLPIQPDALALLDPVERQNRQQRQQAITGLLAALAETGGRPAAPAPAEQAARADLERASRSSGFADATAIDSAYAPEPTLAVENETNQRVFDRLLKQAEPVAETVTLDDEALADTLSLDKGFLQTQKQKKEAPRTAVLQKNTQQQSVPRMQQDVGQQNRTVRPRRADQYEKRRAEPRADQRAESLEQLSDAQPGDYSASAPAPGSLTTGAGTEFGWLAENASALEYLSIDEQHFLLYRRWWRQDKPVVLGVVLQRDAFLRALIDTAFANNAPPTELRLTVTEQNQPVRALQGLARSPVAATTVVAEALADSGGELLYRSRLPAPFGDLQLVFSAQQLGTPPGGSWIIWSAALLVTLLLGGFALIYRFGLRELARRQTQQNFVSAVSHELKTPLTAIRMYGEMLKSGWVAEEKKAGYYGFIFSESERLSRLISNVLRLSQISRDRLALSLAPRTVAELMDLTRSKLQTLSEQGKTEIRYELPEALAAAQVAVDDDAFAQILINLADNAIKFGADSALQRIDVVAQGLPSNLPDDCRELCVAVRDYGPGIPKPQLGRIFDLFYRGESELTRKTQGTGIGLALVAELVAAMDGRVEVRNRELGAEFSVYLPLSKEALSTATKAESK